MTNYLLDTNHLSPLVTIGHPLRAVLHAQMQLGDQFALAAPAVNEFVFGIGIASRSVSNLREWKLIQKDFTSYDINAEIAEQAAYLRINLRRQGKQLEAIDSMIAIIVLRNDLTLLTTDKDFLAVPSLRQSNWLSSAPPL